MAAVGLAVGATVLTLMPSVNAAESAQDIMDKCNKARKINGVTQTFDGIDNLPLAGTCDFEQTSFTTFDGKTAKVTVDYPNCEPDAVDNAKISVKEDWSTAQITGKHTFTQFDVSGYLKAVYDDGQTLYSPSKGGTTTRVFCPKEISDGSPDGRLRLRTVSCSVSLATLPVGGAFSQASGATDTEIPYP